MTRKSFQGLAMYGHEVLMPLQTLAKFLGTHSTTLVTVSVIREFNMTRYLVVRDFLFGTVHNDHRMTLLLKVAVFLSMNHKAVDLILVLLTMNSCLWIVIVYF
jgi:hypothetical protein